MTPLAKQETMALEGIQKPGVNAKLETLFSF